MTDKADNELKAMETVFGALKSLQPEEQTRVLAWTQQKLGISQTVNQQQTRPQGSTGTPITGSLSNSGLTPKAFLAEKRPRTDVERVVCLAYFFTHSRATPTFKTKDLTELNKEAAQPKFSNAAFAVTNANNGAYLAPAGGGQKQITARGEAIVEALPDPEKVRAALEAYPLKSKKRKGRKKKQR